MVIMVIIYTNKKYKFFLQIFIQNKHISKNEIIIFEMKHLRICIDLYSRLECMATEMVSFQRRTYIHTYIPTLV